MKKEPWLVRAIITALIPVDWVIDCLNLYRNGFTYRDGHWAFPVVVDGIETEREFVSRRYALEHLRDMVVEKAVLGAVTDIASTTGFSGKSRNVPCLCGSKKKFKNCCMRKGITK